MEEETGCSVRERWSTPVVDCHSTNIREFLEMSVSLKFITIGSRSVRVFPGFRRPSPSDFPTTSKDFQQDFILDNTDCVRRRKDQCVSGLTVPVWTILGGSLVRESKFFPKDSRVGETFLIPSSFLSIFTNRKIIRIVTWSRNERSKCRRK